MPETYYFNITYACNSCCIFCAANFQGGNRRLADMQPAQFRFLLHEADVRAGDQVVINGGEPTVHPDFFEFLAALRERQAYPILFTNGVRLHEQAFTAKLAQYSPMNIRVPFFSARPQLHDRLTGRADNFAKTLAGFAQIVGMRSQGVPFEIEAKLLLCKATYLENRTTAALLTERFPNLFYFSINPLLIYDKVMRNKDRLVESFSRMREATESTIDLILSRHFLVSLDLLPFCVVAERHRALLPPLRNVPHRRWYFDPRSTTADPEARMTEQFCSEHCLPCLYCHTCKGFYPEYLELFGHAEVQPIVQEHRGDQPLCCSAEPFRATVAPKTEPSGGKRRFVVTARLPG